MRLIHLIRDPLKVAKSEAIREERRRRARVPFHYYTGDDGRRHFCWALTTNEEIYQSFNLERLSLFQKYLIQWIEIENRAMGFIQQHGLQDRCITLDSPGDLNDDGRIEQMFDFFGLQRRGLRLRRGGRRNRNLGHTTVTEREDERQCAEVLEALPSRYLEIFQHEPYTPFWWNTWLRSGEISVGAQQRDGHA